MAANAVDQHLRGAARRLAFSFDDEGAIEVADDGPGFSLAEDERGVTFLERAVSSLDATATLDGQFPHVHLTSSSFGCGLASVAAVARSFSVETVHGEACAQITVTWQGEELPGLGGSAEWIRHLTGGEPLVDALVAMARDEGTRAPRRTLEEALCRGPVARVQVWMLGPEFDSPTRTQLRSPVARPAVARAIVSSVAALPLDAPIRRAIRPRC